MRGRNDADIRGEAATRSHGSALSRLEEPKQHRLGVKRELPDLIHEQGAPIEPMHQSNGTVHCTRKGTTLMAEELAAQELSREIGAVQNLEGLIAPSAQA